ncbi:MAG TPA: NYN domain-containing protein [Spirochaetota bacterium]|nr:NYN domain-containing protein [Spirochaetota bacterium]HPF06538.1 NYN domain-containing protein [Spirochaetota bacterium]HPJ42951.1 NYN domain-containing protein [Spirochaetota bacterium]HPR36381.1 NYN domain-containing protein [Spirochaetota bacterium]HRX47783.1 NYN domain-containing protein [Spirochaetota bacterium]
MALLIDGFNLIYKFPELESLMCYGQLNKAREGLLEILRDYQKIRKGGITVVFDGKKEPSIEVRSEKIGSIDVYYSLDYSADYLIKQFIKKDMNPKMITVVTSDKDIIFYINRFGAKNISSEKFAENVQSVFKASQLAEEEKIEELEKVNPAVSDDEISYWQKIFSGKKSGKR